MALKAWWCICGDLLHFHLLYVLEISHNRKLLKTCNGKENPCVMEEVTVRAVRLLDILFAQEPMPLES